MDRHEVVFFETHAPLFTCGKTFGVKIQPSAVHAQAIWDSATNNVLFIYNKTVSLVSPAMWATVQLKDAKVLGLEQEAEATHAPTPAIRRRRAEQLLDSPSPIDPNYDPNDPAQAEAHRQAVRAASANAYKATPMAQNDALIQNSRAVAQGMKASKAQIENPTQPTHGMTGIQAKPKAISHAQLKAQVKKQEADTTGTQ